MNPNQLNELFQRDLERLEKELESFDSQDLLWIQRPGISNTAGNLALHLLGNLQHFIGHVIGGSNYQRDRNAEFNTKDKPLAWIKSEIEQTKESLSTTLDPLGTKDLNLPYPIQVFGHEMTTGFFLLHLYGHFQYHLGQINYYRRLI